MNLKEILRKRELRREEIIFLLSLSEQKDITLLFQKADKVRKKFCGDEVHLRGIIEFSNYCKQNCLYCGLRKRNSLLTRYRMSHDEILKTAKKISNAGIKTIVLQSGEDDYYTWDKIRDLIISIKNNFDTAITLCLGEREFDEYEVWKEAGADRYLLKYETANHRLYSAYHSNQKLHDRLSHLRFLKSIGFQIGSGNIIGLPNQTFKDIADDILLCKNLNVDMASFSPFISSPDTPYRKIKSASVDFTLKTMAVARIVLKNVHIPATTALGSLDELGREKGLKAGANVIMPNFTPQPYRERYAIYPNKRCITDKPEVCVPCLSLRISSIGREISMTKGDTLKKQNVKMPGRNLSC